MPDASQEVAMARRKPDPEPAADEVLSDIADYVLSRKPAGAAAYTTARYCLMDALGCGLEALSYPACTKLLGPVVPGATMNPGARVHGTSWQLDPVTAAFNISAMNRWLDFNDAFMAASGAHPSDNLGGILATADYLSRSGRAQGKAPLTMRDVLCAMIKAHEIQGILSLENNFIELGLDNVILVKVASTAVVTQLLGGTKTEIVNALSHAWLDGHPLRTYRIKPTLGSRKSWAAADATSRAVRLALIAMTGEMGYPTALTVEKWGFYATLFGGKPFRVPRPYGSYVMENIQFKIASPSGIHGQTVAECAMKLHPLVAGRLDEIEAVRMWTHQGGHHLITANIPLTNPAARDHSLQYIAAIGLVFGRLTAADYEDDVAADPRVDALRYKTTVEVDPRFTQIFRDPLVRGNPAAIEVAFKGGRTTRRVEVLYPLGHPRRRKEGIPQLLRKFEGNLARCFAPKRCRQILDLCADQRRLEQTPVDTFMDLFAR
jgi:2-methylcitrate dehydratase